MTIRVATGFLDRFVIESLPGRLALTACVALVAPLAFEAGDDRVTEQFVIGWLFPFFAYCSAVMTSGLAWATDEPRAREFARALRRLLAPLVWGVIAWPALEGAATTLFVAGPFFPS